jgi:hypothetical protein
MTPPPSEHSSVVSLIQSFALLTFYPLHKGPDPADPERVLVRKILELRDGKYAYEETTISPTDSGVPTVHTTAIKLYMWDMKEVVSQKELNTRLLHRPQPNCVGFSLYYRKTDAGKDHLHIVENTIWKPFTGTWTNWWLDWKDRRDISKYLRYRWAMN